MASYRKKPVVIEAEQYDGITVPALAAGRPGVRQIEHVYNGNRLQIPTLDGNMAARPGDWIVKRRAGDLFAYDAKAFAAIFEPAD